MLAREAVRNLANRFGTNEAGQIQVFELELMRMYAALFDTGDNQTHFTQNNFP